ncbi:phage virion morphogenesis protein [Paracoccus contaminans]|uniref:Phage virion morphogenesis protein n=1 Tax=Paracoccus contaminans TaxID=1945662 RepID=A0A1W6CZ02_9RHOB|nr:phage virion morphogenesis protein [Paracoccus contaminans]ARJ70090.1 phage virion morphogenesis protein [Paracoccus contaminans]
MAGTRITFDATLDDAAAQTRLAELYERMDNHQGFLQNVGEHLLNAVRDRFAAQAGPDGAEWAKLKPATIRERERKRFTPIQILTRHTRSGLRASINLKVGNDQVTIGTPKAYAAIHQFGGTINKPAREGVIYRHVSWKPQKLSNRFAPLKGRKEQPKANLAEKVAIKAHEISMPARPFLGFSAEDQAEVIRIASDWLGD